jgi:hypothetical protein
VSLAPAEITTHVMRRAKRDDVPSPWWPRFSVKYARSVCRTARCDNSLTSEALVHRGPIGESPHHARRQCLQLWRALALNVLGSLTRRWSRERLERLAPQRSGHRRSVASRYEGTAYRSIPRWRRSARQGRFTGYFSARQHRRREPGRDFAVNLRNAYRHGNPRRPAPH